MEPAAPLEATKPFDPEAPNSADRSMPAIPHSEQVKAAFNNVVTPVSVVGAVVDGEPDGMVATSLSVGVSYDPPMIVVSVRNNSRTWPKLRGAARLGVSVLSEHQASICQQIAYGAGTERFSGVDVTRTDQGAVLVENATTWFDCTIDSEIPAGDHHLVVLRVHEVDATHTLKPLAFHRTQYSALVPRS